MSDGEPIRGGFLRGFLVGTLLSLGVTAFLTIVFPIVGQSGLELSTPPNVIVDVPTARSSLGAETSGVETPATAETGVAPLEAEPAPLAPEPVAEPIAVTEAEPAVVDTQSPQTPVVEAGIATEETEQPDLEGFSADVTTPTAEVPGNTEARTTASELQAAELNAMLESPDVSVEPMIPLQPLGGEMNEDLDLGAMASSDVSIEPMIPLEDSIEPMVDFAPDADLAIEPDIPVESAAELAESGIIAVEDAPVDESATVPAVGAEGSEAAPAEPAGDGAEPLADATDTEPAAEAGQTAVAPTGALAQFASAYEDSGERPLLAVILVDSGAAGQDIAKLAEIGMPLTIGILSDVPDAMERTAAYRAAGFEVVAIAPKAGVGAFRRGQNTDDIPLQLEAIFSAVPEAVAVMDPPGGELPKDNQLVRAVLGNLKTSGHALLTQAGGFNSVAELAAEDGVFNGTVMREIEAVDAVNFALSRAALQAGKTGSAVIMANTTPEMVKEVVQWLLSPSARSVALAPVSAALTK